MTNGVTHPRPSSRSLLWAWMARRKTCGSSWTRPACSSCSYESFQKMERLEIIWDIFEENLHKTYVPQMNLRTPEMTRVLKSSRPPKHLHYSTSCKFLDVPRCWTVAPYVRLALKPPAPSGFGTSSLHRYEAKHDLATCRGDTVTTDQQPRAGQRLSRWVVFFFCGGGGVVACFLHGLETQHYLQVLLVLKGKNSTNPKWFLGFENAGRDVLGLKWKHGTWSRRFYTAFGCFEALGWELGLWDLAQT